MSFEQLVDELANVLSELGRAELVVRQAGVRSADIPRVDGPRVFWDRVLRDAEHGRIEGGVRAVVEVAKRELPYNAVFERYLRVAGGDGDLAITDPGWSEEPPEAPKPFPGHDARLLDSRELPELVVSGRRDGARVLWSYRTGQHAEPFVTRNVAWDGGLDRAEQVLLEGDGARLQALGTSLGRLLLGELGEHEYHQVARTLFRAPSDEQTTPLAGQARCRLVLDGSLEALPWRLAAVRDREGKAYWLLDEGWTFEHGAPGRSSRVVSLPNPCSIMFVVPAHGKLRSAGAVLVERARERLSAMWPRERERLGSRLAVVHGHADAVRELHERTRPDVVVFFGRAISQPTAGLEFKSGGEHMTSEPVAMSTFVEELAEAEVRLLYVATTNHAKLPSAARARLPCVIVPPQAASDREVVVTVLSWLRAMLAEGLDPVRALHRPPAEGPSRGWGAMQVHADFRSWTTAPAVSASVDVLARRRIDRDEPRALFIRHVDSLVKDERRRVEAFVAHGRSADRIEWLGDQLWQEYLDRDPTWRAYRQRVPFPDEVTGEAALRDRFERILVEALELEEGQPLEGSVKVLAKERGWLQRPFVYWLDWEARHDGIGVGVLRAWMQLATRELPQIVHGLKLARVVSTLGVVPGNPGRFREVAGKLAGELQSDQTSITAFDALGLVTSEHLVRYLRDPRITGCPERLVRPVAEEIIARSAGDFDEVIRLVETAERGNGWLALAGSRSSSTSSATLQLDLEEKV